MAITLYQYAPLWGMPNASPFCTKLEMYLRLAGLEHTVVTLKGRSQASTRKAPYIEIDGKIIADSGLIIEHLERNFGHRVDGKLTLAQRAESLAFQRMMEDHLYWVLVYARWLDPDARRESDAYIRSVIPVPGVLLPFIRGLVRSQNRRAMDGQGLGRHAPEVLWQLGISDVAALGHWLGTKTYGFGDAPTVFDACLASYIGGIVRQPWSNPLKVATLKYGNLVAHFERMMTLTFPELGAPTASA